MSYLVSLCSPKSVVCTQFGFSPLEILFWFDNVGMYNYATHGMACKPEGGRKVSHILTSTWKLVESTFSEKGTPNG